MATYPEKNYTNEIISRKEYIISKIKEKAHDQTSLDEKIKKEKLILRQYQIFAARYMSPNTPIKRLYVKYAPGMGKTTLAINMAKEYINLFKKNNKISKFSGNIIIIGFTKNIFRKEIIKFPEFGYITKEEIETQKMLYERKKIGDEQDDLKYMEFMKKIKRRLGDPKYGGYFQFYGYREFVNRLFDLDNSIEIKNVSSFIEDVKSGKIKHNKHVFASIENSLIICDEIHNVYNSEEKNIWGFGIEYILDAWKDKVKAVLLSATPLSYNPTEVIDLLNLLSYDKKYKKETYFDDQKLKKNMLKELGEQFSDKVLFLDSVDEELFPRSKMVGESVKGIDILKFIICKMPKFQLDTYNSIKNIQQDEQYVVDIAFPNPESDIGIFKSSDAKNILLNANVEWMHKNKIDIAPDPDNDVLISGQFLNESNIGYYSGKYEKMINDIIKIVKNKDGKIFIYHRYVKMSGIQLIREILQQNGFVDEYSLPNENTLDTLTGLTLKEHSSKKIASQFKPARFVYINSNIDPAVRNESIEKFNSIQNAYGTEIMILLGADIMKESYDLKCVRHVMVMFKPDVISNLIQILGRAKRQYSHIDLPEHMRSVTYKLYISDCDYEISKYKQKCDMYREIQLIENELNKNAVDAYNNFELIKKTFVKPGQFGVLSFEPVHKPNKQIEHITDIYYDNEECEIISYVIKRLFVEFSPVISESDLFKLVKNPPFHIDYNCEYIDDDNIFVTLDKIIYYQNNKYVSKNNDSNKNLIGQLFDINEKILTINNNNFIIISNGNFYMLTGFENCEQIPIEYDSVYRTFDTSISKRVNITDFLIGDNQANFRLRRSQYIEKYINADIQNILIEGICIFNLAFHIQMIEWLIRLFNRNIIFNEKIDVELVKINSSISGGGSRDLVSLLAIFVYMYFYNKVIIFYNDMPQKCKDFYHVEKIPNSNKQLDPVISKLANEMLLIFDSDIPEVYKVDIVERIDMLSKLKKDLSILPTGYYQHGIPYVYDPESDEFVDMSNSMEIKNFVENDVIISYPVNKENSIKQKFKFRPPISKINFNKDGRKIEKGFICDTKNREYIEEIAKKLGVKYEKTANNVNICNLINNKLIQLEFNERVKGTNIKYKYNIFEAQPLK